MFSLSLWKPWRSILVAAGRGYQAHGFLQNIGHVKSRLAWGPGDPPPPWKLRSARRQGRPRTEDDYLQMRGRKFFFPQFSLLTTLWVSNSVKLWLTFCGGWVGRTFFEISHGGGCRQ